jgi:hypothetical protein
LKSGLPLVKREEPQTIRIQRVGVNSLTLLGFLTHKLLTIEI